MLLGSLTKYCYRRHSVWAWGTTDYAVGMHIVKDLKPRKIEEFEGKELTDFGAGVSHSVCIFKNNNVFVWGSNYFGQGGYFPDLAGGIFESGDDTLDKPKHLQEGFDPTDKLVKLSVGDFHSLALTLKGLVYTWGAGILGNGSKLYNSEPGIVSGLQNVSRIKVYENTSSIQSRDKIYAWGRLAYLHPDGQAMTPVELDIGKWNNIVDFAVTKSYIAFAVKGMDNRTFLKVYAGKKHASVPNLYPYNPDYSENPVLISESSISVKSLDFLSEMDCPGLIQMNPVGNNHILLLFGKILALF
jgi:hypothetical protein